MSRLVICIILFFVFVSNHGLTQSFELLQIDTTGDVGRNCMIRVDSTGTPHLLYNSLSDYELKYAVLDNETWNIYESGLYEEIDDFEVDNSANLHCSKAAISTLKYIFINADTAFAEIIDSTNLRYSDSELEFYMGNPKITCIQYHSPEYLLEFTYTDNIWNSNGVTLLPITPARLSYIVRGNVNHASCVGTEEPVLMYYSWTSSTLSIDTVYQDSFYTANDLDVSDDGRVMILLNEDFSRNYNIILAEKLFSQWQFNTIDTSIGYTSSFLIKYSEIDELPYIIFIKSGNPEKKLSLGYRQDSVWLFEDIYSGDIRQCSFDIDAQGNIHLCFWAVENGGNILYYGIRQRITAIPNKEINQVSPLDFELYPNPTNNTAVISFESLGDEKVIGYSVFDILGRKIFEKSINSYPQYSGRNEIRLEYLKNLNSGVYFISLFSREYILYKKITIIK